MCLIVPFIILGPEVYDFVSSLFMILYPILWFCTLSSLNLCPTAECYEDGGALPLAVYTRVYLRINITSKKKTYSIIRKILIQKLFRRNMPQKQTSPPKYFGHPRGVPILLNQSLLEIMRAAASCLKQDFQDFED